jgi:hypothetical protein
MSASSSAIAAASPIVFWISVLFHGLLMKRKT